MHAAEEQLRRLVARLTTRSPTARCTYPTQLSQVHTGMFFCAVVGLAP